MNQEELLVKIGEARISRSTCLSLVDERLRALHRYIGTLTKPESLDLNYNQLKKIATGDRQPDQPDSGRKPADGVAPGDW